MMENNDVSLCFDVLCSVYLYILDDHSLSRGITVALHGRQPDSNNGQFDCLSMNMFRLTKEKTYKL